MDQRQSYSRPILLARAGEPGETAGHTSTETRTEEEPSAGAVPNPTLLLWNSLCVVTVLILFALAARRKLADVPRGLQNIAEMMVEGLDNFTVGIIGPHGRKYTPFVGTIFLYVLLMNLWGLVPGLHSPTSNLSLTLALGVVVFVYVQYEGIRSKGLGPYVKHFMGPMPALAPLMLPVELISELVKPFTLAVRLFGNIFGEDVILIVLAGIAGGSAVGRFIPLHFPVLMLAVLTSIVQAAVFMILTCIYLSLMTSHHEGHHDSGAHDDAHADAGEHAAAAH